MELLRPHVYRFYYFVSRTPKEVATYTSTAKPFSPLVWTIIAFTLFCLHVMFYVAHSMYSSDYISHAKLQKGESSFLNFAIGVYFKVTEPEAIDWFTQTWSTGRFLSSLWAMFCFFIVAFYNSNLRAHLSAITYEPAIDTVQDVVQNGKSVWIMKEMDGNLYVQYYIA